MLFHYISYVVGFFAHIPLPKFLAKKLIMIYVDFYNVDLSQVERSLESFSSIGEFFTRTLKPGARPIKGDIVSPCDSTLRQILPIIDDTVASIKGVLYSVAELIKDEIKSASYKEGILYNFYLSPKDYHHVHSAVAGKVTTIKHIPGTLWPVNDSSFKSRPKLFAENERIIFEIDGAYGPVMVVMIAALNVGNMEVCVKVGDSLAAGDRLGIFCLGSSVALILNKNYHNKIMLNKDDIPRDILLGEKL